MSPSPRRANSPLASPALTSSSSCGDLAPLKIEPHLPTPPPSPPTRQAQLQLRGLRGTSRFANASKVSKPAVNKRRTKAKRRVKDEKALDTERQDQTVVDESLILPGIEHDWLTRSLTPELVTVIFEYLDLQSLTQCQEVCRAWKSILEAPKVDHHLWRGLYFREYGNPYNANPFDWAGEGGWRKRCLTAHFQIDGIFYSSVISQERKPHFHHPTEEFILPLRPSPSSPVKTYQFVLPSEDRRQFASLNDCLHARCFLLPATVHHPSTTRHPTLITIFRGDGLRGKSHVQIVRLTDLHATSYKLKSHSSPIYDATVSTLHGMIISSSLFPNDRVMMNGIWKRTHKAPLGLCGKDDYEISDSFQPLTNVASDGSLVCCALGSVVYIFDIAACMTRGIVHIDQDVEAIALKNNLLAASTIPHRKIQLHTLFPPTHIHTFEEQSLQTPPLSYRPHLLLTDRLLFASSPTGEVYIYDLLNLKPLYSVRHTRIDHQNAFITSMTLSEGGPPGETLAVGLSNGDLALFDFTAKVVRRRVVYLDRAVEKDPERQRKREKGGRIVPAWVSYREGDEEVLAMI
ncbi:hypothetical protein HK097_011274 [Rhizophlyctis rosea]|uniref:F-box domain-containing protein n=1 Tax=Rhizophlyctis rosea TaxID=64517 RepID=A0AAD5X792_9FUNG|nr:hypothetical protein HK097_011274 [Rhizophlyctis rosea]